MHQIIFLLAVPRSGSTVLELAFQNSGLFGLVLHEPNADCYYQQKRPDLSTMKVEKMDFLDYSAFKAKVLEAAQTGRVFIKDMVHYFYDEIAQDPVFCKQIDFIFLIRDPLKTIQSYLSKDPKVTSEEIGFDSLARFGGRLDTWGIQYQQIDYSDLVFDPEMTLKNLCEALQLPYKTGMSRVKSNEEFRKLTDKFEAWHTVALQSTQIEPKSSQYQVEPTDPRVQELFRFHLPFYQALKAMKTRPSPPLLHAWGSKTLPKEAEAEQVLDTEAKVEQNSNSLL